MAARRCKFGKKKGTARCRKRPAPCAKRTTAKKVASRRKAGRCKFGVNRRTKACLKRPRRK